MEFTPAEGQARMDAIENEGGSDDSQMGYSAPLSSEKSFMKVSLFK